MVNGCDSLIHDAIYIEVREEWENKKRERVKNQSESEEKSTLDGQRNENKREQG